GCNVHDLVVVRNGFMKSSFWIKGFREPGDAAPHVVDMSEAEARPSVRRGRTAWESFITLCFVIVLPIDRSLSNPCVLVRQPRPSPSNSRRDVLGILTDVIRNRDVGLLAPRPDVTRWLEDERHTDALRHHPDQGREAR